MTPSAARPREPALGRDMGSTEAAMDFPRRGRRCYTFEATLADGSAWNIAALAASNSERSALPST